MKKVLFATTALVLTAGVAAADVTVSGDGRLGVIDNFGDEDLAFSSRIRITFTATGETDGGLQFGGSVRADNAAVADGPDSGRANEAGSVFISGRFGTLSMGDLDGAAENAVGDVSGVGMTGLADYNETIYLSGDDFTAAVYEYSFNSFSFFLGATQTEAAVFGGADPTVLSLGAKYSGDMYSVGIGYENADDADVDHIIIGGEVMFGGATFKANYGQADAGGGVDADHFGVSIDYTFGATTITAFYRDEEEFQAIVGDGVEAYGIGAAYDLGGGATLKGGYVSDETNNEDAFDFGVVMSF